MKTTLLILGLLSLTGSNAFSQSNKDIDPSYSIYNYKHANKADYARKHQLNKQATLGEIMVVQNDNYKQSNRRVRVMKVGAVAKNDKYKTYPNYKHPVNKVDPTPLDTDENYNTASLNP